MTWNQRPRLNPPRDRQNGVIGSLMFTFQRDGSEVLKTKHSWVIKQARGLFSFLKRVTCTFKGQRKNLQLHIF